MWIPTTESRELLDLEEKEPRDAASHELKHWVKNRMKNIGVTIRSPDKDTEEQYWPELRKALTPENIAEFNRKVAQRIASRR